MFGVSFTLKHANKDTVRSTIFLHRKAYARFSAKTTRPLPLPKNYSAQHIRFRFGSHQKLNQNKLRTDFPVASKKHRYLKLQKSI